MRDVRVAGLPGLARMVLLGRPVGTLKQSEVGLGVVLLDDGPVSVLGRLGGSETTSAASSASETMSGDAMPCSVTPLPHVSGRHQSRRVRAR